MRRPSQIASLLLCALSAALAATAAAMSHTGPYPNYRAQQTSEATPCGLYKDLTIVHTSNQGNGSPLIFQTGGKFIGAAKAHPSSNADGITAWTWSGLCTDSYSGGDSNFPGCTCDSVLLVDNSTGTGNTTMYLSCLVQAAYIFGVSPGSGAVLPNGFGCTAIYSYSNASIQE